MKSFFIRIGVFFSLWVISLSILAQAPAGYYDAADGLSGTTLQQALHDIIDNHTVRSYSQLWTDMQSTDAKASGKVWDMYSDIPSGTPDYEYTFGSDQCGNYSGEGSCYNREHSFPKSWFNDASPMYSDLFHLYPTDGYVNGRRGSYPFGEVSSPTWTSTNGSKVGPCSYSGYSGTVFEPIDEYKGDFARTYFYMATRYYGEDSGWPGSDMVNGSQPVSWALSMLMEWHTNDPVSTKETDRNDAVYAIQGNRNPFIDNPDYVDCIWGSNCGTAPQISNIATSPASPTSSDAVDVSATITDDGTISSVTLDWGTDGSTFPNSISMTNTTGDTYETSSTITAQIAGTSVYFKITATDNDTESTTSSTNSYTIPKSAPTTQASNLSANSKGASFIELTWVNGDGDNRVVIVNATNSFTNPSDGDDPTATTVYGGSGEQTIYNGNSNSVTVTGLSENTQYWFRIYEYNNSGSATKYISSTATNNPSGVTTLAEIASEDFTTCPATGWTTYSAASNKDWACSSNAMDVNGYAGDAASDDWLISPTFNLDNYTDETLNFDTYTKYTDATYPTLVLKYSTDYAGSGDPTSATWNTLTFTASAENSSTWTNSGSVDLSSISGSSVYIAFHYTSTGTTGGNCAQWSMDNFSISGIAAAACTSPGTQASNISFSSVTNNSMTVSWNRGDGDNVLVVARAGSAVDTDPSIGSSYSANVAFSSGDEIGSGNYVVYNGTGTSAGITTLSNSTSYHFALYEYNNTDVCYNLSELTGSQSTNGIPTISTTSVSSITATTASSGGDVTSDGGSAVTARGVCWSTSTNPTTSDSKTSDGTGTGSFTSSLTSLSGSTTYYVRAYATNSYGTAYGDQVSFSTLKDESSNHVTSFATGTTSSSTIELTWTDVSSGTLPDAYLIKASATSYAAITDPVDGTEESDATLVKNINQGTQNVTFSGLSTSTTYYFKIYPYANSGSNILFNTNATIPTASTSTDAASSSCATDLFISEYIEGSSNNKAIEIYNGTENSISLGSYSIQIYSNGNSSPSSTISLNSVSLASGDVYILANSSAGSSITSVADQTSGSLTFNGNDAVVLYNSGYIDIFGNIGEDPGSAWTDGISTVNKTLVRKSSVADGITTDPTTGFPTLASEWDEYNQDVVSYLGSHTIACSSCTSPTLQASSFSVTSISNDQLEISWTRGDGDNVLVLVKAGNAVDIDPSNGTSYTANATFTSGEQIGTGNYVVYNGTGTSVTVTGLSNGTTYHFALCEYNNTDVCYLPEELTGSETTYDTPTILTTDISNIATSTASSGGNVTNEGGPSVTAKGIVWGTSSSPTIPSTSSTLDGTGSGVFTSSITGLTSNTTYYARSYATNSVGTSYGDEISFTTLKDEPTNHATSFVTGATTSSSLELTWTDASGGTEPDGYLVKMSDVDLNDISNPVDGTAESDGALVQNITQGTQTCTFSGLASSTTYYFKIYPYSNSESSINYKTDGTVPSDFDTTDDISGVSCPTELIISEYIEGSSLNKAIEIYNKTGNSVDLSNYSLKKQSNGSGAFGDELILSGTLADETTYLIVNSGAGSTLTSAADLTTASACLAFNGNDAVGLYKSSTMIDVVGVEDQTSNWGADQTLIRNSDITTPVTIYNASEWSSYSQDYFSDIGTHSLSCGTTCSAPTTQTSSITISSVNPTSFTVGWTLGDGDGTIIKINTSNSFSDPVDGTDPTANSTYSSGEQVVYNGSGTSVDISGLSSNTQYFVKAYEYKCSGSNIKFITSNPPENNMITVNAIAGSSDLLSESFETDGHSTRYTASSGGGFNDGTSDHFNRTDGSDIANTSGAYSNADGTYFWAAEDTDDNGGSGADEQTIVFTGIDISGYSNLTFYGLFGAGNENVPGLNAYDKLDYIKVTYEIDAGGEQNGIWFSFENHGDDFNEPLGLDADFDGEADVNGTNRLGIALQEFSFSLSGTGSSLDLTIKIYMDSGNEEVAIDNLRISGDASSYTTSNDDYFRTCTDGDFNNSSTWQSSDDNSAWYNSSLVPDENATTITISANNSITRSSDINISNLTLSSGSSFAFSADNLTLNVQGNLSVNSGATLDVSRTGSTLNLNGSSVQTISGDGTISAYNLSVNNANNINLSKDLSITNQLTLTSGLINTGANTLTIENASTSSITGHSIANYINGTLKRAVNSTGSYDFPVGTATNYEYANVVLNSSSGINYLTASFGANSGTTPNLSFNGSSINSLLNAGIWTISPDAITSVNYDITVISRGHTNGATAADYHTLLKRDNSGTAWGIYGNYNASDQAGSGTDPITMKRTGITSFSDFGGGPGDAPMPVELVFFEGIQIHDKIELNWQTASEINNDFFTVEKSADAVNFDILQIIEGFGNSNSIIDYSSEDLSPHLGINYYRLKQTDFNGEFSYSETISVNFETTETNIAEIKFSSDNNLFINFNENIHNELSFVIFDIMGRLIETHLLNETNLNRINYNLDHLHEGIYHIAILTNNNYQSQKILIKK